jgi:spoIIIJ-associated protein
MTAEASGGEYNAGVAAGEFITEVVEAMGLRSEVSSEEGEDGTWRVSVEGPDSGDLIGANADALNALQYLATIVAQRRMGEHVRLVLDADNYRRKREQALMDQALELAGEVARLGQEAELDPLSSYERRIIHNALTDHPDVITYSEGEDSERRVVIAPRPAK